jgi:hypothetical protein
MRNISSFKEYKGYRLQMGNNGICFVYRNNQLLITEPNLQLALNAIDNRIYSNPDFKLSGYHQYDNVKKFKEKKEKKEKEKRGNAPRQRFTGIYKSVDMKGEEIEVEVIRGKDKDKKK